MNFALLTLAQSSPPAGGTDTQTWLVWGIVLLAMAIALFFVEVFLPTGGLLGIGSGVAAVAGVVMFFQFDTTLGLFSATACLVALPFLILFALKLWPDTPFGKWVTLADEQPTHDNPEDSRAEQQHPGRANPVAVGTTGKTLTPLRPVGTCLIAGRREECLARRGTIDAGVQVKVVGIDGSEIYVTAVG